MFYEFELGSAIYRPNEGVIQTPDGRIAKLNNNENLLLDCLVRGVTRKRDIMREVWDDSIVTDSSYHRLIFELRKKFSSLDLNPDLIQTIPRRGCFYAGKIRQVDESLPAEDLSLRESNARLEGGERAEEGVVSLPTLQDGRRTFLPRHWRAPLLRVSVTMLLAAGSGYVLGAWIAQKPPVSWRQGNSITVGSDSPQQRLKPNENQLVYSIRGPRSESLFLCTSHTSHLADCKNYIYTY